MGNCKAGAPLTLREYRSLLHRNTKVERELGIASGAFQEVITDHFFRWSLTAAERDVALFLIKGLAVADIAALRQTRDGTIKAQSAAIYRKAGVSSRSELISVMVEELIQGLITPNPASSGLSS
ncbi:helix-turn-helix transcriptional regulator [Pseudorhodobacter sp. W20_MBD10_FR17]|uniref:helix-turn-helix transcriptional regulator n=1 Tax=Pseudorhodobacter sp. W20_MBD10_FR17 TaxID=3240266 RepID=UPI003F95188C